MLLIPPLLAVLGAALPLAGSTMADDARHPLAVRWLVAQQQENGAFGEVQGRARGQLGITAIVAHALAGVPEELREEVAPALAKAETFLLSCRQDDGSFSQGQGLSTYSTAVCVLALAAGEDRGHGAVIAKAAKWLKTSQLDDDEGFAKDHVCHGGFSYGPVSKESQGRRPVSADLSNTHMALAALAAAGVKEKDPVFRRARVFLARCQNHPEVNDGKGFRPGDDGGFIYDPVPRESADRPAPASYASMTYSGLACLGFVGVGPDDPAHAAAMSWAKEHYTLEENAGLGNDEEGRSGQAGLYYFYYSFAEFLAARGEKTLPTADGPSPWAKDLMAALGERQREDGSFANSDRSWWENNPVLATGFAVLAMNQAQPFLEAP